MFPLIKGGIDRKRVKAATAIKKPLPAQGGVDKLSFQPKALNYFTNHCWCCGVTAKP